MASREEIDYLARLRKELAQRGVNAWRAYQCCRNAGLRAANVLEGWASLAEEVVSAPAEAFAGSQFVRLLPQVGPLVKVAPKVVHPTRVTFFVTGFGVDGGEVDLEEVDFPHGFGGTDAQLVLSAHLRALSRKVQRKTPDDCEMCIRKNLWKQSKARRRFHGKDSLGNPNKLLLRVPHA